LGILAARNAVQLRTSSARRAGDFRDVATCDAFVTMRRRPVTQCLPHSHIASTDIEPSSTQHLHRSRSRRQRTTLGVRRFLQRRLSRFGCATLRWPVHATDEMREFDYFSGFGAMLAEPFVAGPTVALPWDDEAAFDACVVCVVHTSHIWRVPQRFGVERSIGQQTWSPHRRPAGAVIARKPGRW
jgi:hypothetical protein